MGDIDKLRDRVSAQDAVIIALRNAITSMTVERVRLERELEECRREIARLREDRSICGVMGDGK